MSDPKRDEEIDLFSRTAKNVESNLSSLHQRSAWETASMGSLTQKHKSSSVINDSADETASRTLLDTRNFGSISGQQWPSPLATAPANNYRSVGDSSQLQDTPVNKTTLKINPRDKTIANETTFMRPGDIGSSSALQLAHIITQHILLHPFVALRRTCQVNRKCSSFICVQPFSLMPFMYHLSRKQGIPALYKGLSSELLVKSATVCTEKAIANYANWPTEVGAKRKLETILKLLALRGLTIAINTPLTCSAVIDTVQSVIVVRDQSSFVDCVKNVLHRTIDLSSTPSARTMPIWLLVVPTVGYYVAHSAIWHVAKKMLETSQSLMALTSMRSKHTRRTNRNQTNLRNSIMEELGWDEDPTSTHDLSESTLDAGDRLEVDSHQISTAICASFVADVALLPIETVLNSLYVQGTRTIIDNCDETTVVLPVLTNYDGFADCYQSILKFEGSLGIYKGLGAIVLQYSVHYLIFRSLYYLVREFYPDESGRDSNMGNNHSIKSVKPPRLTHLMEENRHSTPNNLNEFTPRYKAGDGTPRRLDKL